MNYSFICQHSRKKIIKDNLIYCYDCNLQFLCEHKGQTVHKSGIWYGIPPTECRICGLTVPDSFARPSNQW